MRWMSDSDITPADRDEANDMVVDLLRYFAIALSANLRVTFCFEDGFAVVDYVDYH